LKEGGGGHGLYAPLNPSLPIEKYGILINNAVDIFFFFKKKKKCIVFLIDRNNSIKT